MNRVLTVLIVEDLRDTAQTLAVLIRAAGHNPVVASSGRDAIFLAAVQPPDVVLMDIGLPDIDGYETARCICAGSQPKPVLVALTGFPWLDERSQDEGFDNHLLKPVDPEALHEMLRRWAKEPACVG
jgi:two-component system CheB/CheR fusion protein